MKKLFTKSFVAGLIIVLLLASVSPSAVSAYETLWSGKALSTVGSPAATITWDLPWGLDADPAAVNIWSYPPDAVPVTLADVEWSMPSGGLLIWHCGGPTQGWRFYKKGWGAVNTLEALTPSKGYIGVVLTASVWEIPQETTPTIENLIVTAKGHMYLRKSTAGGDYDVWKTKEYDIECIASGTGELVYNWSCNDGEISGEGSTITWTAPNKTSVRVTVMVIVSDVTGNSVAKNIVFTVPSCTCGSWG